MWHHNLEDRHQHLVGTIYQTVPCHIQEECGLVYKDDAGAKCCAINWHICVTQMLCYQLTHMCDTNVVLSTDICVTQMLCYQLTHVWHKCCAINRHICVTQMLCYQLTHMCDTNIVLSTDTYVWHKCCAINRHAHMTQIKVNSIPVQALRVPWAWDSQISRQSAREGSQVVSPTHWLSLPPRTYSWYSSVRRWVNPRAIV
jgi:hypothetical protein